MSDRIDGALLERGRRALRRNDAVLGAVIRRVGACDIKRHGDPYRYLVRSVVHQQITGKAAAAIETRLKASFGGRVPAPARLRSADVETLRGAGLSRQKVASLHAIASAFDDRVARRAPPCATRRSGRRRTRHADPRRRRVDRAHAA